ncbi:hypothetical protein H8L32_18420 [Undibacterium sp. CY18W]|uniref:Carboxypeptidase regulatory-like domain-containing protein n=1 Tax=Undibacterium hunanense TaxID=2762292 RepID=A0ABR6ZUA3_9BURK|nr:hypothetical protein [Undibacterium hunanense]MBC3919471.1 hypothetical protein [Undibacterium hunanense]
MNKSKLLGIITCLVLILAGCGGFVYTTVGGTVTGLTSGDTLVLRNDANYTQTLTADGTFSFNVASNGSYAISVLTQPNTVNCTVVNGTGKMTGEAAVKNIIVTCVPNVPIGGTLAGLADSTSLVLVNNNTGLTATVSTNGTFLFGNYVVNGNAYTIAVGIPPAAQYCTVANGTGTANILNTAAALTSVVTCVPAVPVKFTVTGMTAGTILTMVNTANAYADKFSVTLDGTYGFNWSLLNGVSYVAAVDTQPSGQTCKVANGTGVIDFNNPTAAANITVTCAKS